MREEELSRRLSTLATAVERATRVPPAVTVRDRAGRRPRLRALGVAAAVAALAGIVGYPLVPGDDPAPPPTVVWPDPTALPPDLRLPHEGDPGWRRDDDVAIPSAFSPCRRTDPTAADATAPGRTAAATVSGRDPDPGRRSADYTEHLFLYTDEAAAATAMRALVDGAARCGWQPAVQVGAGGEPERLHAARAQDGPFAYATALRRGNVLFVVFGTVETSITDGTDEGAMATVGELLCASRGLCPARSPAEASWSPVPSTT